MKNTKNTVELVSITNKESNDSKSDFRAPIRIRKEIKYENAIIIINTNGSKSSSP